MLEFVVEEVVVNKKGRCIVWVKVGLTAVHIPFDSDADCASYFKVADLNELVGKTLVIGIRESGE